MSPFLGQLKRQFAFSSIQSRLSDRRNPTGVCRSANEPTAAVAPEKNSYSFLFRASWWFENPAHFKDRDAFRAGTNVAVKDAEQSRQQAGAQCDVIFAQWIA